MTITFDEFQTRVNVIHGAEADRLRVRYIERFVDTESEYFRRNIAARKQYEDGLYYQGYLWDTLKNPRLVTESQVVHKVPSDKNVYAFWDLHSSERICVGNYWGNYWRFPRDAVLESSYGHILQGKDQYLPEDLYVFDYDMELSIIFTHESNDSNERYCYEAT